MAGASVPRAHEAGKRRMRRVRTALAPGVTIA
jgi:hypothetical protein